MKSLILTRDDIRRGVKEDDIIHSDVRSLKPVLTAEFVVYFYDNSWKYKILKNRFDSQELPEDVLNEIRYRKLKSILS